MHRIVGTVIRMLVNKNKPRTLKHAHVIIDQVLVLALRAIRTNIHQGTGYAPGALAFHRDMLLNVPLLVNMFEIRARRQVNVDRDLMRANARRTAFDYKQGEKVLKKVHDPRKLEQRWDGPYPIERVHVNGNVTIALKPGVLERIYICQVRPYLDQN